VLILLALILLLGVLAAYLFLRKGPSGGQPTTQQGTAVPIDRVQVVIAAQHISRGSKIAPDAVILSPFPADSVVETMMTDKNLVVGRYARQEIDRGVPITQNMLTEKAGDLLATGSEASLAIPPGYTAIAVPMTRLSGVAYALQDGDKVDVLASMLVLDVDQDFQTVLPNEALIMVSNTGQVLTGYVCQELKPGDKGLECTNPEPPPFARVDTEKVTGVQLYVKPAETQRPRLLTQRLIQNATVLHVGTFALPGAETTPLTTVPTTGVGAPAQATPQAPTSPAAPDIVTLIVTPQDALALDWAVKSGLDLTLTLRGPSDSTPTDTTTVTLKYLVDNYNITVPSKLPYGLEPKLTSPITPVLPGDQPTAQPKK
jgi:pilus assembly protein CpaB